ncbi:MAG: ornithine carbamoyltransferase [Clostridiales bacterium]|nr:ornithine carbamoyltransferase [Clostridiales bacterium]
MKHLLKMMDLSQQDILDVLDLADQLKYEKKHNINHHYLKGKTLGMIFQKSSTRTRVSFEVGMNQLGGNPLFLSASDLQLGRGESIEDTAKVLSRYLDGIMIRTYDQQDVEDLAKYGKIPIINGLTDESHPCQVLADLMTIREHKRKLEGLKLCYIGDGNNMANSLIVGGIKVGMRVAVATPKGYEPMKEILDFARDSGEFVITQDSEEAAQDADVLVTDVWISMGQEKEVQKRRTAFAGYQINSDILAVAAPQAMVQHCLPAHKGEEISLEVFNAHQAEIFDEAENRLHVQKAILVKLMG